MITKTKQIVLIVGVLSIIIIGITLVSKNNQNHENLPRVEKKGHTAMPAQTVAPTARPKEVTNPKEKNNTKQVKENDDTKSMFDKSIKSTIDNGMPQMAFEGPSQEKNAIKDLPPLNDPIPEQTKAMLGSLYKNYSSISDIQYTAVWEFEPPNQKHNATKRVYVKFPKDILASLDVDMNKQRLGHSRKFNGKMRIESKSSNANSVLILSDGKARQTIEEGKYHSFEDVPQEELYTEIEGIDALFFFNYVSYAPDQKPQDDYIWLKSYREEIALSKDNHQLKYVVGRDLNNKPSSMQEFIDYEFFSEYNFYFPKHINLSLVTSGKPGTEMKCKILIENVKINAGIDDKLFSK